MRHPEPRSGLCPSRAEDAVLYDDIPRCSCRRVEVVGAKRRAHTLGDSNLLEWIRVNYTFARRLAVRSVRALHDANLLSERLTIFDFEFQFFEPVKARLPKFIQKAFQRLFRESRGCCLVSQLRDQKRQKKIKKKKRIWDRWIVKLKNALNFQNPYPVRL